MAFLRHVADDSYCEFAEHRCVYYAVQTVCIGLGHTMVPEQSV
jgi:hypothetical protein